MLEINGRQVGQSTLIIVVVLDALSGLLNVLEELIHLRMLGSHCVMGIQLFIMYRCQLSGNMMCVSSQYSPMVEVLVVEL